MLPHEYSWCALVCRNAFSNRQPLDEKLWGKEDVTELSSVMEIEFRHAVMRVRLSVYSASVPRIVSNDMSYQLGNRQFGHGSYQFSPMFMLRASRSHQASIKCLMALVWATCRGYQHSEQRTGRYFIPCPCVHRCVSVYMR